MSVKKIIKFATVALSVIYIAIYVMLVVYAVKSIVNKAELFNEPLVFFFPMGVYMVIIFFQKILQKAFLDQKLKKPSIVSMKRKWFCVPVLLITIIYCLGISMFTPVGFYRRPMYNHKIEKY